MKDPPTPPQDLALIAVCPKRLLQTMSKQSRGRAPGPSGWTEDLLFQSAMESEEVLAAMAAMIRDICNGDVSPAMRQIITASRLITPAQNNKLRPIAIGEAVLKIAEAYLLGLIDDFICEEFAPLQHAFVEDGVGRVIHEVRSELNRNRNAKAVLVDCKNAFNTIHRATIFESTKTSRLHALAPIINLCYAHPSLPHHDMIT